MSPNYESALVSSYDPFQISTQITQLPSPLRKSSPYAPKDKTHLFIIESVLDNLSEPVAIAKHYFPPNFHFMPQSPYKSLKYYRDILNETQSVEIKPVKDCNQPHIILYHSLYIHQILSQENWGKHPYDLKTLQSNLQYCYADYIEAWYTIFLHQTVDFSHSWFINFDSKFNSPFPFWFLHWWESMVQLLKFLPPKFMS